jgi:asparagine synthase (glutamine-hydrolysing)
MCGLVGCVDFKGRPIAAPLLDRMTAALVHRGPDSCGSFLEGSVGLGFRRLRIIDLATGDQPLYSEDGQVVMVCNGEIFNYRELAAELVRRGHVLRTRSDVEVLIHLYEESGCDLFERINGQFSFALFDRRRKRLLLARDPFGINPLFYCLSEGVLLFASEIKAILEHPAAPREVDLTGLDQVLCFPGLVPPRTLFKGISSLPGGHWLSADEGGLTIREYWDLIYPQAGEIAEEEPESFYCEGLGALLSRAVDLRLQADVPVGFYLSGGLDSSLIGALAAQGAPSPSRHSFSIAFADKEICEAHYQGLVARHLGTRHHEILFDWERICDSLRAMVEHCECPVKETFNTCALALSAAARQAGVPVVLAGQGADELFAGYMGYRFDQAGLRQRRQHDLAAFLEDEIRERLWGDRDVFYELDFLPLQEIKEALYSPALVASLPEFDCLNFPLVKGERLRGRHYVHQRSYLDVKLRLSEHLLSEHGDRMALANSVEARYPFLDSDLVQFATRVPPRFKLKDMVEKYIVKRIAEGLVPDPIINREKFGFRAPGSPFLLRQGCEWIDDLLSYGRIKSQGYFNPDTIERLKALYRRPGFAFNPHLEVDLLMIVLTFGILLDRFRLPEGSHAGAVMDAGGVVSSAD